MSKFLTLGVLVATGASTAAIALDSIATELGRLSGAEYTYARSVNAAGDVAGYGVVPMSYQFCDTRTRTVKTAAVTTTVHRSFVKTASGALEEIGTYAVPGSPEYVKNAVAVAISDAGQVVGTVSVAYPSTCFSVTGPTIWFASERAGKWTRGTGWDLLPLDPALPDGQWASYAYGANRSGDAVGWAPFMTPSGEVAYSGALWRDGSVTPVGVPASDRFSYAFGVNELGQVVGQLQVYDAAAGIWHYSPYLWSATHGMVTLPTPPGGSEAYARAVNERGQVLVSYTTAGGAQMRFYVWTPDSPNGPSGSLREISAPAGGAIHDALGINDQGQVFGAANFDGSGPHAALWVDGEWHDLEAPGAQGGSTAYAMNRSGAAVGDRDGTVVLWQVGAATPPPPADVATGLSVTSTPGTYGGSVTLSATLSAGGSPLSGKPIAFRLNGAPVASAVTNSLGTATVSAILAGIAAGSYPGAVEASFAAESGYLASSESASLTVGRASQAISFAPLQDGTYGDASVELSASATSGLPVGFAASGRCSVAGATLSITGAGSCTVTATQLGDANHEAAAPASHSFAIAKADPQLAWSAPAAVAQGSVLGAEQLDAAASFGGAALDGSYAYTPVAGAALTAAGPTELTVRFVPADSANFNPAEARVALEVTNVAPVVTMGAGAKLLPGETFSSAGSFTDPGTEKWTGSVSYGEGPGEVLALEGSAFSLRHVYQTPGQYTVQVTVSDASQAVGTGSVAVLVQTPVEAVRDLAAQLSTSLGLSASQSKALGATLQAAMSSLNARRAGTALLQLNAFSLQIDALVRSRRITAARGEELKSYVDRLSRAIRSASGM